MLLSGVLDDVVVPAPYLGKHGVCGWVAVPRPGEFRLPRARCCRRSVRRRLDVKFRRGGSEADRRMTRSASLSPGGLLAHRKYQVGERCSLALLPARACTKLCGDHFGFAFPRAVPTDHGCEGCREFRWQSVGLGGRRYHAVLLDDFGGGGERLDNRSGA